MPGAGAQPRARPGDQAHLFANPQRMSQASRRACLKEPDAAHRPHPHEGPADDVALGQRPPITGVVGVGPVVTHHEQVALRDLEGVRKALLRAPCRRPRRAVPRSRVLPTGREPGLLLLDSVDIDRTRPPRASMFAFYSPTLYFYRMEAGSVNGTKKVLYNAHYVIYNIPIVSFK